VTLRRIASAIDDWFFGPADPRAYAALRIGYAVSCLAVLADIWPLRSTLLSSSGMFGGGERRLSLNVFAWIHGDTAVTIAVLFFAAALACLALGIAQRLSAVAAYLWVCSYSATAPIALSGFDTILRVVGFVIVISPVVPTWTLGRRSAGGGSDCPPPSYGLRLVQWQVMLIYLCTVWLKAPDPFWRNGSAVPYFLMSMFARHPTSAAAHLGALGAAFTYGTLLIEVSVPFLLWMRKTRWLGVASGAALHLGIAATSDLALFTLAMLPLYAAFFEAQDFDEMARWIGFHSRPPWYRFAPRFRRERDSAR
jgi:hypothetical protein